MRDFTAPAERPRIGAVPPIDRSSRSQIWSATRIAGRNGWGNNELEYYTSRLQNLRQHDGPLIIEAAEEKFVGSGGLRRDYTSGRLNIRGVFSQKYGRFEAQIKNPSGPDAWPAFWLLGDNFSTVGWPNCGEIDVMEEMGSLESKIHGSIHGPGYSGRHALSSSYVLPSGNFHDSFHVFALEWEPGVLRFYVDGQLYAGNSLQLSAASAAEVSNLQFPRTLWP